MTSSMNSKNAPESYIGSFISLISKYEIRYEGILYHLNVNDSTIGLKNVKSFGTEGRKKDGPQVPPSEKVYEYILFRGSDIKDLEVKSSPPPLKEEQIYQDPAIIQSQYAGVSTSSPSLSSVSGKTLTESSSWQDTPALNSRANPGALPSHQPSIQVGPLNHPQAIQNATSPSFPMPMYWQGYNGPSNNISPIPFQPPSTVSSPLTGQNASPVLGLITASGSVAHGPPPIAPNQSHPNFSSSPIPVQFSPTPLIPFSASLKGPLPSTTTYMTDNNPNMSLVASSCQDTKTSEAQISGKAVPSPVVAHPAQTMHYPAQTMHYPASSFLGSASGPLLTPPPPSLLTPDQLVPPRPPVPSSTQAKYSEKKDMGAMLRTSFNSPSAVPPQVTQPPLLPLPTRNFQSQYSTTQFTEEFDFEAMNEKFRKDEVWGYLGKAKQSDKPETIEDNATDQNSGGKEADGLVKNVDPRTAYKKDDFFDTISCNSLNRGTRDGQNRFSDRMKLDTETFGNFRQRGNLGYGGYSSGRGGNYRGPYGGGRGYDYSGRGRGGNMHM